MSIPTADARPDDGDWPPFRVLCVDDNPDCADSTALMLRVMGFEAKACYGGQAALALNDTFRPSVCLIDLNMPDMPGDDLARRLLAAPHWRPLLLVAITARDDENSRARTKAAGFHLHLVKPADPSKVLAVVDALFQAAAALSGRGSAPPGEAPPSRD
jgi:CheY-like chemotaxis protein